MGGGAGGGCGGLFFSLLSVYGVDFAGCET